MPVPQTRNVAALDHDFELRPVPDHCDISIQANRDRLRLPVQVLDLPGADATQVLLLRECTAQRVDELEVIRVKLLRSMKIAGNERSESFAFGRAEKLHV